MPSAVLTQSRPPIYVTYDQNIEDELAHLETVIEGLPDLAAKYHPRWLAVQLLEGEETMLARVRNLENGAGVYIRLKPKREGVALSLGLDAIYIKLD